MSSSQKLLEQFSSDSTWGLLLNVYWRFLWMVLCHWTRWLPWPFMVKALKKSSFPEPRKFWGWILVYSIADKVYQVCSNDDRLTFDLFMARSNLHPIYYYGENFEKSFSQNVLKTDGLNLQCLIKVVKLIIYNQNFVPWGSALAPWLYTCIELCNFWMSSSLKLHEQFSPDFT